MKLLLSIAIPVWFGTLLGALTDETTPHFWGIWSVIGLVLVMVTAFYIHDRRLT